MSGGFKQKHSSDLELDVHRDTEWPQWIHQSTSPDFCQRALVRLLNAYCITDCNNLWCNYIEEMPMKMKMKMTWAAGTRCKVAFKSHLRLWGTVRGEEGQLTFLRSDRLDLGPVANASTRYCSHLGNSVRAGHTFTMEKALGETLHYSSIFSHFMWLLTSLLCWPNLTSRLLSD